MYLQILVSLRLLQPLQRSSQHQLLVEASPSRLHLLSVPVLPSHPRLLQPLQSHTGSQQWVHLHQALHRRHSLPPPSSNWLEVSLPSRRSVTWDSRHLRRSQHLQKDLALHLVDRLS